VSIIRSHLDEADGRGVPDPDALQIDRDRAKADMLERMGGGTLGKSTSPSDHDVKPSVPEAVPQAVKVEEPEAVTGIDDEEEEEEFIDEGDPVVVPWGATPPPESPEEEVEEQEGNYSEDEVYAEPGTHPRNVNLTCSIQSTSRAITAREFGSFCSVRSGPIYTPRSPELLHHARTRCDRCTPSR
jgi:hypothetical protein